MIASLVIHNIKPWALKYESICIRYSIDRHCKNGISLMFILEVSLGVAHARVKPSFDGHYFFYF